MSVERCSCNEGLGAWRHEAHCESNTEVESHAARLTRLRTTGFRKLRPGCMHVRCYVCGRKMSNVSRASYDPPTAVLIETPCGRCAMGSKDPESFYFDAAGEEVKDQYCELCGTLLDGGMVERASDSICVECADDDFPPLAPALAVDPSRSTPKTDTDPTTAPAPSPRSTPEGA